MRFYLGTHRPQWLNFVSVPLFVSRRTLYTRRSFPRAIGRWALDSGAFSELSMFGEWRTGTKRYAREVALYRDEIGNMDWAAPQDWMCEPHIIAKTGLTVKAHQWLTIENYERLLDLDHTIQWMPVLQGWTSDDYMRHIDYYLRAFGALPEYMGIGSICRRQGTTEGAGILRRVAATGIKLHGFGLKISGLRLVANELHSADSLAWSFTARRRPIKLDGCPHKNCANCIKYALCWRQEVLDAIGAA